MKWIPVAASVLAAGLAVPAIGAEPIILTERIDVFDPVTSAYRGTETTWFDAEGRRLRWEILDGQGNPSLQFFILLDEKGREKEAIFFEDGGDEPSRETFTYDPDGGMKTTTYYYEPGVASDRTEEDLDERGREIRKRFFNAEGVQYGTEDVSWNEDGSMRGWDFRYVRREGGASFRFEYLDAENTWTQRIRKRDGVAERREVRTIATTSDPTPWLASAPFAPGVVSTEASETSPSFSADGKTMVFARYGDDWTMKEPYIARLADDGWQVEPLADLGPVYNLALAPDGRTILFATRTETDRRLFRLRWSGSEWSAPEDLTAAYGLAGAYPCLAEDGTLFFYDAEGPAGEGLYAAPPAGDGFGPAAAVFTPPAGPPFDGFTVDGRVILATRCFDESCGSGPENGIWEIDLGTAGEPAIRKLPRLPYGWGAQRVPSLGLLVFTDGEDILAVPLAMGR